MNTYNASDIKILREHELDVFPWHEIETLAEKHKKDVDWVRRGFEACYQIGMSPQFFIDKYILKHDLPKSVELEQVFTENMRNSARKAPVKG